MPRIPGYTNTNILYQQTEPTNQPIEGGNTMTNKEAKDILKHQLKHNKHKLKDYDFLLIEESIFCLKTIRMATVHKLTGKIYSHIEVLEPFNLSTDNGLIAYLDFINKLKEPILTIDTWLELVDALHYENGTYQYPIIKF